MLHAVIGGIPNHSRPSGRLGDLAALAANIIHPMADREDIMAALEQVPDPEMPISIVDLGMVEDVRLEPDDGRAAVTVVVLPTFIGCPALDMIRGDIEAKVGAVPDVASVTVEYVYDPPWSVDRISTAGRESLREHGVTVPETGSRLDVHGHVGTVQVKTSAVPCPYCGSDSTYLDSAFGPTKCRSIFYCSACRNSFEHMKRV